MASRRRAREMALHILCALEKQPELAVEPALALYFKNLLGSEVELDDADSDAEAEARRQQPLPADHAEQRRFAEELVRGARAALAELDELLSRASRNWRLSRMAWVDRNLLRLATYELAHSPTPVRVVLNESIELAKRYGTSESGGFVNGVLDRVVEELGRRPELGAGPGPAKPSQQRRREKGPRSRPGERPVEAEGREPSPLPAPQHSEA